MKHICIFLFALLQFSFSKAQKIQVSDENIKVIIGFQKGLDSISVKVQLQNQTDSNVFFATDEVLQSQNFVSTDSSQIYLDLSAIKFLKGNFHTSMTSIELQKMSAKSTHSINLKFAQPNKDTITVFFIIDYIKFAKKSKSEISFKTYFKKKQDLILEVPILLN